MQVMGGDVLDWYFTNTTINDTTPVNTSDREKYGLRGAFSQQLVVNNVSVEDDGYYFCRIRRTNVTILGTCLEAQGKSTCQVEWYMY
jgi:hypothetical protein